MQEHNKIFKTTCIHQIQRSSYICLQSDPSRFCQHEETLGLWLTTERPYKTVQIPDAQDDHGLSCLHIILYHKKYIKIRTPENTAVIL